jgi:murein hydrolase activator
MVQKTTTYFATTLLAATFALGQPLVQKLPVIAQEAQNPDIAPPGASRAAAGLETPESVRDVLIDQRGKAIADMEAITRSLTLSGEARAKLETEVAAIKADEAAISAALLEAATKEQRLNADIAEQTEKLALLGTETETIRASLIERSGVLAEVLAALQRLGRNPPPALLVTPQDALSSVRSAVLLGAVVPAMRIETLALKTDLERLVAVGEETREAKTQLTTSLKQQIEDQARLDLLLEEKRKLGAASSEALIAEAERGKALEGDLKSLQALLDSIDSKIADVEAAATARRDALEKARQVDPGSFQIGPAVEFAALRGQLPQPAEGPVLLSFGARNDAGITVTGDTIATRSGAIVTAPADAIVAFAAPFRSYRNLVILDTGGGYKMVVGGMERLGVTAGQTVLAGEPIGSMPAAIDSAGGNKPSLYVELRKDGQALDPRAWWRKSTATQISSGQTNDDT